MRAIILLPKIIDSTIEYFYITTGNFSVWTISPTCILSWIQKYLSYLFKNINMISLSIRHNNYVKETKDRRMKSRSTQCQRIRWQSNFGYSHIFYNVLGYLSFGDDLYFDGFNMENFCHFQSNSNRHWYYILCILFT